jgi:hypothetical protein
MPLLRDAARRGQGLFRLLIVDRDTDDQQPSRHDSGTPGARDQAVCRRSSQMKNSSAMPWFERIGQLRPFLLPVLILAIGLATTAGLWSMAREDLRQQREQEVERLAGKSAGLIEERLRDNLQLLRAAAGLFDVPQWITRERFRRYFETLRLQDQYPGIQGLAHEAELAGAHGRHPARHRGRSGRRAEHAAGYRHPPQHPRDRIGSPTTINSPGCRTGGCWATDWIRRAPKPALRQHLGRLLSRPRRLQADQRSVWTRRWRSGADRHCQSAAQGAARTGYGGPTRR